LPLARGSNREAVRGRPGPSLRLPTAPADLHLRTRANARAGHAQGRHGWRGRAGGQSARPQRQAPGRPPTGGATVMAQLRLDFLLRHAGTASLVGEAPPDLVFTSITNDSRAAAPGALFLAIEATRDGHDF